MAGTGINHRKQSFKMAYYHVAAADLADLMALSSDSELLSLSQDILSGSTLLENTANITNKMKQ